MQSRIVWGIFAIPLVATLVTYWRLPPGGTYNFDETGAHGALSRVVTYLNFPVAIAAIALLLVFCHGRWAMLAGGLCLVAFVPGAFWVAVVALTELVGGLMLVFGVCTRFAAAVVAIFMINAIWITSAKGFFWTQGGSEYSILILATALVFLVKGGGQCSIDRSLGKEL